MENRFEEKEEVTLAVNEMWKAFGELERGQIILWDDIEKLIQLPHGEGSAKHIIGKWRAKMLNVRSIATRARTGVGIQLLTCEQQATECAEDRQRRAHRQCNRGMKEVSSVDGASLGLHLRRLQNATMDSLRAARKQIRSGVREVMKVTKARPIRKE